MIFITEDIVKGDSRDVKEAVSHLFDEILDLMGKDATPSNFHSLMAKIESRFDSMPISRDSREKD